MLDAIRIIALASLLLCAPAVRAGTLEDFGGHEGVIRMTTEFVDRVVKDDRINHYFKKVDGAWLIHHISSQICNALGGPCKYTGRSMKEIHKNMGVKTAEFNALVEDLCDAMDHLRIRARAQNKLLRVLAPMWRDVVTR